MELRECPFCGAQPEQADVSEYYVECPSCGLQGPYGEKDTYESSIAAWNRRASPASVPEGMELSAPTILPDGSGFGILSLPLPKDHWLYAEREYEEGAPEPKDLPAPILTHALRQQVIDAIRYAVRSATNCGKETDFDPDALVQNAVYALCGPYGAAAPTPPVSEDRWQPIETAPKDKFVLLAGPSGYTTIEIVYATGRMCSDYHVGRWIDHANDDLTDWGFEPTHWRPLPKAPAMQEDKP